VLVISCMSYYTNRLYFFNHNTALLVAHADATYCVWRCVSTGRSVWWLLLGLCWGVGMLSKYQMLLSIACNVGFLAWLSTRPGWRAERREFIRGLLLAGTLCAAALAPHVAWLVRHDFPTFAYASRSMAANLPLLQRPVGVLGFFANQICRVLPVTALALLMLRVHGRRHGAVPAGDANPDRTATIRLLYLTHAAGPFVLMTALALLAGMELQMHWGTAFLWALAPLALLAEKGRRFAALPMDRIFMGVLLQALNLAYKTYVSAG
jgi:4-amino-4-deoxy-L-arabinose transferase-like glycosyltransferase